MTSAEHFRGLGRLHSPDKRDRLYPMRATLRPTSIPKFRYYDTANRLLPFDQGTTSTCVGQAWAAFLLASPLQKQYVSPYDIYRGAVAIDEWDDNNHETSNPDHDLHFGSSVRAGVKYLQAQGHIRSYVWAYTANEAAAWLLTGNGTLVAGTDWYWGMGDLDKKGFARLDGGIAGGHAYLVVGYSRVNKAFRCLNSWGRDFGVRGRFWIAHDDMHKLIQAQGEMCAAVEQLVLPVGV